MAIETAQPSEKNPSIKSSDRVEIVKKIEEYERLGLFDIDVEADPPDKILMPKNIDYTGKKFISKVKTEFANWVAKNYFEKKIRNKAFIIKEVRGIENFLKVKGGAILTCNHFNAFDNYAVLKAIEKPMHDSKRRLYKIIREGNYTSFKGIYGFFFRNCNTLPLSGNLSTLRCFFDGVKTLLARGEKILVYPEQAMWWNYKKPRPLKDGAFSIAVKNKVPVIPFFITLNENDLIGDDGFNVLEYTIHILPAIYPDNNLSTWQNIENMKNANYLLWKDVYESVYNLPLSYSSETICKTEEKICSME